MHFSNQFYTAQTACYPSEVNVPLERQTQLTNEEIQIISHKCDEPLMKVWNSYDVTKISVSEVTWVFLLSTKTNQKLLNQTTRGLPSFTAHFRMANNTVRLFQVLSTLYFEHIVL